MSPVVIQRPVSSLFFVAKRDSVRLFTPFLHLKCHYRAAPSTYVCYWWAFRCIGAMHVFVINGGVIIHDNNSQLGRY